MQDHMHIDQSKQLIPQVVSLHQVARFTDNGLIRHGSPAQIDTHETAFFTRVIRSFLDARS